MNFQFCLKIFVFSILLSSASLTQVINMQNNDNTNTAEYTHLSENELNQDNEIHDSNTTNDSVKGRNLIFFFKIFKNRMFRFVFFKWVLSPGLLSLIAISFIRIFHEMIYGTFIECILFSSSFFCYLYAYNFSFESAFKNRLI